MPFYDADVLAQLEERVRMRKAKVAQLEALYPGVCPSWVSCDVVMEQAFIQQDEALLAKFREGFE